ncbi:hypothetical protein BGX23_004326, partial [Mortierella sp. AD031]
MTDVTDLKPFHPGLTEDMEGVHESDSPILTTQEAEAGLETGVFPEFVTVSRSRATYCLRFPVAHFGSSTLSAISKWATTTLAKFAPIKANTFSIRALVEKDDESPIEYLLFQVHSQTDMRAAYKHGGTNKDGVTVLFRQYTQEAQALQQDRVLELSSLAFNTRVNDVHSAMKDWGQVESIRTGFNLKMSMATATVVFKSAAAITDIKKAKITCLTVVKDVGTVTRLGDQKVSFNPALTLKLAHLPRSYSPADVKAMFDEHLRTPNATSSYHSLTMPLSVINRCRKPEAFHPQRNCGRFKAILSVAAIRRANSAIIKGVSPPAGSASHPPLTQVPKSGAVPRSVAAPSSIPKQSSTPSKASSYATAATPMKKGITGSNPVSVQSSASVYASAHTHTVSSAAATPAATAAPSAVPSDWLVQRINEISARISATDSRFEKYIHAQIQAMEARLEAKLDRFINALGAAHGLTPSAIEPEDIELEQAADLSDEIIPATPPSQLPSV